MRSKSIYISSGLHLALLVMAMIGMPWLRKDLVLPQPIAVELVDISQLTQTDKPKPPQPKPVEKKEEIPKPPPPPPAAKNSSDEAITPVKDDKKEDDKKKEETIVKKDAPPEKKPPKKDDKKKEKTEPKKDFQSVLKNLENQKDAPKTEDKKIDPHTNEKAQPTEQGTTAPVGEKLTMSEEDALRHQLEQCWNVPFGAKDAENLVVDIIMTIRPDRTLQDAVVADKARYHSDTFFRAAADSAIRAVRNPLCSPFAVPPDKYETWKTTTVTFNPKEMF